MISTSTVSVFRAAVAPTGADDARHAVVNLGRLRGCWLVEQQLIFPPIRFLQVQHGFCHFGQVLIGHLAERFAVKLQEAFGVQHQARPPPPARTR
jgi:hypothetical protein